MKRASARPARKILWDGVTSIGHSNWMSPAVQEADQTLLSVGSQGASRILVEKRRIELPTSYPLGLRAILPLAKTNWISELDIDTPSDIANFVATR